MFILYFYYIYTQSPHALALPIGLTVRSKQLINDKAKGNYMHALYNNAWTRGYTVHLHLF